MLGYVRIFVLRRAQNGHSRRPISFGSVRTVYGVVLLSLPSGTQTKMAIASGACIPIRPVLVGISESVFEKNPCHFFARRWYERKRGLNVNICGTLWMLPEKEVASNEEVSDSSNFYVFGVHNVNAYGLRRKRRSNTCAH